MSQTLNVQLSDEVYAVLQRQAAASGTSPSELASQILQREYGPCSSANGSAIQSETDQQAARTRFERHFGVVNLGHPTGADNESIDADLAGEYADTHEEK